MKDLLVVIAQGLVEDPAAVRVDEDEPLEDGTVVYHLHVAENDMGAGHRQTGSHCKSDSCCHACRGDPGQWESFSRD